MYIDLCVSAALSAVKDMVEVPWRKARDEAEAALAPRSDHEPDTGIGSREDVIVLPQETDLRHSQEAVPQPVTSVVASDGITDLETGSVYLDPTQNAAESRPDDGVDVRSDPSAVQIVSDGDFVTTVASTNVQKHPTPGVSDSSTQDEEAASSSRQRVLLLKHFEVALREIRPSSSEEGSLPELRKVGSRLYPLPRSDDSRSGRSSLEKAGRSEDGRKASARVSALAKRETGIAVTVKLHKTNETMPCYLSHHGSDVQGITLFRNSSTRTCSSSSRLSRFATSFSSPSAAARGFAKTCVSIPVEKRV